MMSEKTTLLPSAPTDERFVQGTSAQHQQPVQDVPPTIITMPRIVLAPGFEFDPSRKYRYGLHSLFSAIIIFVAFILVELRDCNWAPGIDLSKLQALHISLMVFAFVLYLLSLFSVADYTFQYRYVFLAGVLTIYLFVGFMIWMTYEAATNPCVKTFIAPIDLSPYTSNKNVFARGDGVGIVVLLLDIFATILMFSSAANFYKRF